MIEENLKLLILGVSGLIKDFTHLLFQFPWI